MIIRTITRRRRVFGAVAGLALACLLFFVLAGKFVCAVFALYALFAFGVLTVHESRVLARARLICESRIMGVRHAVVIGNGEEGGDSPACGEKEWVLSPFGLLVGGKVYKFGCPEARLYSMSIGESKLTLTFGEGENRKSAALLYDPLTRGQIIALAEKVYHETGVVPLVVL